MPLIAEKKLGRVIVRPKKAVKPLEPSQEILELHRELEIHSKKKLELKINDNRSTMLSVKWEADRTRVSLHRIFLEAPDNVMQALACYIARGNVHLAPTIRVFIEENLKKLDYSHLVHHLKLTTQGQVYNLQTLYDSVNAEYFNSQLKLSITWFGNACKRNRSRLTFGLYHDQLKLIKIHRILDGVEIPEYLIKFIIYHEILHCVSPSYYDDKQVHHIHSKEFKALEKLYRHYEKAQKWIQDNKARLFLS